MSTPVIAFQCCADGLTVLKNVRFLLEPTADRVLLCSSSSNYRAPKLKILSERQLIIDPKERKTA
jgi:hypothetical protein